MLDLPGSTATMMVKFTFAEMADMYLIYGAADGSGREATRLYTENFLIHQQLHHSTFTATDGQLCETDLLRPIMHNMG
jgi:hypothetical protein